MLRQLLTLGSLALAMVAGIAISRAQDVGAKVDGSAQAKVAGAADVKADSNFVITTMIRVATHCHLAFCRNRPV